MSDRIRYQYESLEGFAQTFAHCAAQAESIRVRLMRQLQVLESGGWYGGGAKAFGDEMRDLIFPALDRLDRALDAAQAGILRAAEAMREAEQEAAALFRGIEGGAAQVTAGLAGGARVLSPQVQGQIAALNSLRNEQSRFTEEIRRGVEGLGSQVAGVQAVYDRLFAAATARSEQMLTLIDALQGGAAL